MPQVQLKQLSLLGFWKVGDQSEVLRKRPLTVAFDSSSCPKSVPTQPTEPIPTSQLSTTCPPLTRSSSCGSLTLLKKCSEECHVALPTPLHKGLNDHSNAPRKPMCSKQAGTVRQKKRNLVGSSIVSRDRVTKKPFQQLYLDFGQKNFAQHLMCNTCGMMFVHGVAEDARQHTQICENIVKGVPFFSSQARIVGNYHGHDIVEIRPSDKRSLRLKVLQVLEIVDQELGIASAFAGNRSLIQQTAYLYVVSNRVVAMVTAECIDKAYVLQNSSNRSTNAQRAMLGIHRMWVHTAFRKQGVASRLIDAARSKMVFGLTVSSSHLAFSSPTEAGISFGSRYMQGCNDTNTAQILVYDCGVDASP